MKGRITTVLSLTGVLVAGSAAALVNTQVLQNTESKSSASVPVGSTDNSNANTPVTIAPGDMATKINSSVLTSTQAMYQIGDAGLVTLDTSGGVLTVVSVTPSSGWTVVKAENDGSTDIEVKLQSGNMIVEFKANLQFGVITTSVESKIVDSGGNVDTTVGIGTINDDDGVDVSIAVDIDGSGTDDDSSNDGQ